MKIVETDHMGTLTVMWKDCYQHEDRQTIGTVQPGQMVVSMSSSEFQRFKRTL